MERSDLEICLETDPRTPTCAHTCTRLPVPACVRVHKCVLWTPGSSVALAPPWDAGGSLGNQAHHRASTERVSLPPSLFPDKAFDSPA